MIKSVLCIAAAITVLTVSAFADNKVGVVTGDVVNVRAGRGTDTSILTQVYRGERYNILGTSDLWTEIEYIPGRVGFIHNNYFKVVSQKGMVIASGVNVREAASTGSRILGNLSAGAIVDVKSIEGSWYQIEYNSIKGWMYGEYVRVIDGNDTNNKTSGTTTVTYNSVTARNILAEASKYVGLPYVYGATGPNAFDCSGFTQYVFKKFGISLPRVAASQAQVGYAVTREELKPGDLVFFENGGYIDHVGIYIGNGQMVHAGSSRTGVCYTDMDSSYFDLRYSCARRVIN